jgi:outer membrane protein assembly factor BamB
LLTTATTAVAVLCISLQPAIADDWLIARGDLLGSGVAKSALPVPESLDVLWTYKAAGDAGFDATAVAAGGIIYIGDNAGTFHAVKLADGTPAWTKSFDNGSFTAAAAIEGDNLYVGDLNGVVRALAIADGTEKWQKTLEGEVYAGPTPYQGNLLVTSEAGSLSCLSMVDGHDVWKPFKIEAPLRCTPSIAAGRVLLAGCDSLLHFINIDDGTETGTVEIDAPTGATPAVHGERVFFGTEGGTFFAIDVPAATAREPAVAWTFHDPQRGQPIRAAAAANDQVVVYGTQGKAIYGFDLNGEEPKWKLPTRARIESSPVIAGNFVVVATAAGKLYVLDAGSGEVKWEHDFGGGFAASPIVIDGKIILGNTDGTLYCIGAKKNKEQLNHEDTKNMK